MRDKDEPTTAIKRPKCCKCNNKKINELVSECINKENEKYEYYCINCLKKEDSDKPTVKIEKIDNVMDISKNTILSTMKKFVEDCRDTKTNEVNYTQLAEMTCDALNAYEDDDEFTIPEIFFEVALDFE